CVTAQMVVSPTVCPARPRVSGAFAVLAAEPGLASAVVDAEVVVMERSRRPGCGGAEPESQQIGGVLSGNGYGSGHEGTAAAADRHRLPPGRSGFCAAFTQERHMP